MSKIDRRLSERFREAQRDVGIVHAHDQLDRRRARRMQLRRIGSVVLAATVLAGTLAGVALLEHAFRQEARRPGDATPTQPTPTTMDVQVAPGAWHIAVAYGSVWISEPNRVIRVDAQTGTIVAEIPIPQMDEADITAGGGFVWVTTRDDVVGIDEATNLIAHRMAIQTGIREIEWADGSLYVGHSREGNGDLTRVDPTTDAFLGGVLTGGEGLGESAIVATTDAFWVGYSSPSGQGTGPVGLVRVPSDLSRADVVDGVERAFSVTEAGGFVWAVGSELLYQVTLDGALVGTFAYPRAAEVASDGQHLWLLLNTGSTSDDIYLPDPNDPTRIVEVDTQTGALLGDGVTLPHYVPANIAAAAGVVWVSFYDAGILTKLTFDSPVSTPGPTVAADDLGLGFPVCDVRTLGGDAAGDLAPDFDGNGTTDTAYVATKRDDLGGCPQGVGQFVILGVDLTGDGMIDAQYGPLGCQLFCTPFMAVDLDEDGDDELFVEQLGGAVLGLVPYSIAGIDDVDVDGPGVSEMVAAPPGDEANGFTGGGPVTLYVGGDEGFSATIDCKETESGLVLIATTGELDSIEQPTSWTIRTTTFKVGDQGFEVIDSETFERPVGEKLPDELQRGDSLCGQPYPRNPAFPT